MGSNRSIRLGAVLLGGAFLLLVLYLVWQSRRSPEQPVVVENTSNPSGATEVSMQTGRRSAVLLADIPERSIITADMFRMEELPESASGRTYVVDPEAQAIGFITNRRLRARDRLRTTDLAGHISEVGIAGALSPGTRAMILPLPSKPTFHDLVRVGGYIDVIAAFDQQESRTIVENVRVLAVDVFGNDYPQASVAMRGPFKAPSRAIRSANPAPAPQQGAQPAGNAAPGATPTPTPTPTATPQPAAPAAAITIEVTPEQANRISLAQNSGGVLDFILVPRPTFVAPGATPSDVRVATVTRAQLAPYAESKKKTPSTQERTANTLAKTIDRNTDKWVNSFDKAVNSSNTGYGPNMPNPAPLGGGELRPAGVNVPEARPTYEIPIYADGTKVRTDVVLKPKD